MNTPANAEFGTFFSEKDLSVEQLEVACSAITDIADYPLACAVESNVVLYEADQLLSQLQGEVAQALKAELAFCLLDGPGVFVIKSAYSDNTVIDASTQVFREIVAEERASGSNQGDHFGENERIWNASQKVCERSPAAFLDYYCNPFIAIACEAWLGPNYQITAQMNTVKPGSKAQHPHRDYHLGFQSKQTVQQYPAHAQYMSQFLTLQGAIAHTDMPLAMGPTMFLPHSQKVASGYLLFSQDDAADFFQEHYIQLPLEKGDMVFFNPALMHGAGRNDTQQDRVANLLQISSAFGRPMETVNRLKMITSVYNELKTRVENGLDEHSINHAIAAIADGYSFPTNLDSDPPIGGNAPETAQQMVKRALETGMSQVALELELTEYALRQTA